MTVRRRVIVGVMAVAVVVPAWMAWRYGPAAALLLDLAGAETPLRAWLPATRHDVSTADFTIPTRHGEVAARLFRPATSTNRSVVVFPGIHAGGVDEPRLVEFARRLASAGVLVTVVPLPDLRRYRVTPDSTDIIEDATAWTASARPLAPSGRVGLVGISFAGGLAIVAAGRPGLDGRLAFVASLGGHGDLPRVMAYLCGAAPPASGDRPPHDYGTVVILLGALPHLLPADQVAPTSAVIRTFLDASSVYDTEPGRAEALFDVAQSMSRRLPDAGRQLAQLVVARDTPAMGARAAPHIDALGSAPALSPMRSPAPRVPVFLIHGAGDNVIPSAETPRLAAWLAERGTAVRWTITPLVGHAEVRPDVPVGDLWRLVRFWTSMMDAF
jgi:dienelactone hydrolase